MSNVKFEPGSFVVLLDSVSFNGYSQGDVVEVIERCGSSFKAYNKYEQTLESGFCASSSFYRQATLEEINEYLRTNKKRVNDTQPPINNEYSIF